MRIFFYIVCLLACFVSVAIIAFTFSGMNAVQQTSGLALACAVVIIPYVFARSYQELRRGTLENKLADKIGNAVAKANRPPV